MFDILPILIIKDEQISNDFKELVFHFKFNERQNVSFQNNLGCLIWL